MHNAENGIRFITPDYTEKFRVNDGESIRITYSDGETCDRICRYIDDFHTEVGDTIYHICEFAERMEKIGAAVAPLNGQNSE